MAHKPCGFKLARGGIRKIKIMVSLNGGGDPFLCIRGKTRMVVTPDSNRKKN